MNARHAGEESGVRGPWEVDRGSSPSQACQVLCSLAEKHKKPPKALSRREAGSTCILKRVMWLDFREWVEMGQKGYTETRPEAPAAVQVRWWEQGL